MGAAAHVNNADRGAGGAGAGCREPSSPPTTPSPPSPPTAGLFHTLPGWSLAQAIPLQRAGFYSQHHCCTAEISKCRGRISSSAALCLLLNLIFFEAAPRKHLIFQEQQFCSEASSQLSGKPSRVPLVLPAVRAAHGAGVWLTPSALHCRALLWALELMARWHRSPAALVGNSAHWHGQPFPLPSAGKGGE